MKINLTPQRSDLTLELEKTAGNRLRINGELFNFNPLEPGDIIAEGIVPSPFVTGPVEHKDGHVTLTLILPVGINPSKARAFPASITVTADGPIKLPE